MSVHLLVSLYSLQVAFDCLSSLVLMCEWHHPLGKQIGLVLTGLAEETNYAHFTIPKSPMWSICFDGVPRLLMVRRLTLC